MPTYNDKSNGICFRIIHWDDEGHMKLANLHSVQASVMMPHPLTHAEYEIIGMLKIS
jgi:hypothetical protein